MKCFIICEQKIRKVFNNGIKEIIMKAFHGNDIRFIERRVQNFSKQPTHVVVAFATVNLMLFNTFY